MITNELTNSFFVLLFQLPTFQQKFTQIAVKETLDKTFTTDDDNNYDGYDDAVNVTIVLKFGNQLKQINMVNPLLNEWVRQKL